MATKAEIRRLLPTRAVISENALSFSVYINFSMPAMRSAMRNVFKSTSLWTSKPSSLEIALLRTAILSFTSLQSLTISL